MVRPRARNWNDEVARAEEHERAPALFRRFDFAQIEGTIAPFTDDDSYAIEKLIDDLENTVPPEQFGENFTLLSARKSMAGTAKAWFRMIRARTWLEWRAKLIEQFHRAYTLTDVLHELNQIEYDPKLGLNNYVIRMKEVAAHSPSIDDHELMSFIRTGLKDKSSRMSIIFGAKTLDELRGVAADYDRARRDAIAVAGAIKKPAAIGRAATGASASKTSKLSEAEASEPWRLFPM